MNKKSSAVASEVSVVQYEAKDLPYYTDFKELATLDDEVEELETLQESVRLMQEEVEERKAVIQALMESTSIGESSYSVRIRPDLGVSYVKPTKPSSKLVRELLILAGVTEKQLRKGTKTGPPNKPHVQLLLPKKSKEVQGGDK